MSSIRASAVVKRSPLVSHPGCASLPTLPPHPSGPFGLESGGPTAATAHPTRSPPYSANWLGRVVNLQPRSCAAPRWGQRPHTTMTDGGCSGCPSYAVLVGSLRLTHYLRPIGFGPRYFHPPPPFQPNSMNRLSPRVRTRNRCPLLRGVVDGAAGSPFRLDLDTPSPGIHGDSQTSSIQTNSALPWAGGTSALFHP